MMQNKANERKREMEKLFETAMDEMRALVHALVIICFKINGSERPFMHTCRPY